MKKKNYLFLFGLLLTAPWFTSCSDDDDSDVVPTPDPVPHTYGAYILSSGSYGKNNSTLDYYDFETQELNEKVFSSVNGRELGDTANDMIIYGSKLYVAVDQSSNVEVMDFSGKSLAQIVMKSDSNEPQEPRYLTASEGSVYVSTYAGFVAKIDTASLSIVSTVDVGSYPEQICVSNGKLYAAISGWGAENKVVSVDLSSFQVDKTLEVVVNPTMIQADAYGYLYVLSSGNYYDIPKTLQRIDPSTGSSTVLLENSEMSISLAGDSLYVISAEIDPATWLKGDTDYKIYNVKTAAFEANDFVSSSVSIENATFTYVDPISGQRYITAGDYATTGDVYVLSSEGELVKKIPVSGINPLCVRFITSE